MNRAERRRRAERARHRVRRLMVCYAPDDPSVVGQLARTRKPCSCWMCSHHNGKPIKFGAWLRYDREVEP